MDNAELAQLVEQLDDNIDDLEEALRPLFKKALSDTADKLPLIEKSHLYVLVTYAIESILFSYLRLNAINAKEHPIFRELTRVKQYFEKIKIAQSTETGPNAKIDKAATNRFIKHALAGNRQRDAHSQHGLNTTSGHIRFDEGPRNTMDNNTRGTDPSLHVTSEKSNWDCPGSISAQPIDSPVNDTAKGSMEKGRKRKHSSKIQGATTASMTPEIESKGQGEMRKKLQKEHKARQ